MKNKLKKRILAKSLCFVLIVSSSISVMAEDSSVSSEGEINITSEYTDESESSESSEEFAPIDAELSEESSEESEASEETSESSEASEETSEESEASEETSEESEASEETSESFEASEETSESSEASEESSESSESSEEIITKAVEENVFITRSLYVNSSITDNGDENPNTFAVVLEAWVGGIVNKVVKESEVEETQEVQSIVNQMVFEDGTTCDSSAVLRSQLSQYFEYCCSCEGEEHTCIEVYTAAWDGAQFLEPVQVYPAGEQSTVSVAINNGAIEVSGFDYKEHTVVADEVSGNGQKLVVKASVEPKAGFWGGNNVPVTEEVTAVYVNGEAEASYAGLTANVPVCVEIATLDKTIYYGGSTSDKELLSGITAGYKTVGTTEANGVVCVNDDGTLTPAEDWMDDYAVITWNTYAGQSWTEEVSNILGNTISKIGTGRYEYAVTIRPIEEAIAADTNAGAGNSMEGVVDSAYGFHYVLIPVARFRNTIINHGFVPDQEYFENYNKVSVDWIEMSGFALESEADEDPYTYPAPDYDLEPTLYFTYEPIDPTFTEDTGVDVIVSSSNDSEEEGIYISNIVLFGSLLSTLDVEGNEGVFTISVNYATPIELPATGGMGTAGFRTIGLVLMMCAVVLVWKKKRNVE